MLPQTAVSIIGGAWLCKFVFYAFAIPLTLQIFPGASDEATHVGMIAARPGSNVISRWLGDFLVRNDGYRTQTRFVRLRNRFAAISLSLIKIGVDEAAMIPIPAIEVTVLLRFFRCI